MNKIFLSPPDIGKNELKYVQEAFVSNYVAPLGPATEAFEKALTEYTGIPYCLALNSGTAALHLALKNLNISSEDVVIASDLTFIASLSNAYHMGAEIRFIDCNENTWGMDVYWLQRAFDDCKKEGKMPKAVIVTDMYGQCADYDAIKSICDPLEIPVIIDGAEALGATYKGTHAGSLGDVCALSFNGNKIITTSGGGALLSHNKDLIDHARKLSTQAREPYPYYEHKEVGFNYRLSNICAAIGLGQLESIAEKLVKKCKIFENYKKLLAPLEDKISFMPIADYGIPNYWLTVIQINLKKTSVTWRDLWEALAKHNVESRPVWKPMHLQPVFKNNRCYGGTISEKLFMNGICLPSGTALTFEQQQFICDIIIEKFL